MLSKRKTVALANGVQNQYIPSPRGQHLLRSIEDTKATPLRGIASLSGDSRDKPKTVGFKLRGAVEVRRSLALHVVSYLRSGENTIEEKNFLDGRTAARVRGCCLRAAG